jgi:sulfate adenylyltransferase subunit 1 (EFTu-like GTPase family)
MVNNSETTTTSWTLDTTTQLRPSLRLTVYVNYGSTTTEVIRGEEDSSYVDGGINLNYRPSDALQSNTSISYDGDDDSVRASTSVSLRLSNDLQANVGAALTFEDDVTQNYTASLIWLMTQRFSLRQGVQYARADLAQWSYSANASYNF